MTAMNAAVDVANQMRGTPVKLTFSREEDFQQDIPRQISMARNRGAVEKGKIVAADIHVASPSLARSQFAGRLNFPMSGPDTTLPNGIWSAPYAIPNFRNTIYAVDGLSPVRSEEHTSELQSLMRISYAVFHLKKKKTKHKTNQT